MINEGRTKGRGKKSRRKSFCKEEEPINGKFVMNCLRGKKDGFSWGFSFIFFIHFMSISYQEESVQILH